MSHRPPIKMIFEDPEGIGREIDCLKNEQGIHILSMEDNAIEKEELGHIQEIGLHDAHERFYLIVLIARERAMIVMQRIEDMYFPAINPDLSALWDTRIIKWFDLHWMVVGLPITRRDLIEQALQKHGCRMTNGIPTIVDRDGIHKFPVCIGHAFHVEDDVRYQRENGEYTC